MTDDLFSLVHDSVADRMITCLIQGVLKLSIHTHMSQGDPRHLLQLPLDATPVDPPYRIKR